MLENNKLSFCIIAGTDVTTYYPISWQDCLIITLSCRQHSIRTAAQTPANPPPSLPSSQLKFSSDWLKVCSCHCCLLTLRYNVTNVQIVRIIYQYLPYQCTIPDTSDINPICIWIFLLVCIVCWHTAHASSHAMVAMEY